MGKVKAEVVAVANQKGGVGKSTTAEALAGGLAIKGNKVLLIDLDPQCNLTLASGADAERPTSLEIIKESNAGKLDALLKEAVQTRTDRVDVIAASASLATLDVELFNKPGKELRLSKAISPLTGKYQYIVIDTPPALGTLTINALTAANRLIIPAQADMFSLQGIMQLHETIEAVKEFTNRSLSLAGILLTRDSPRTVISRDMTADARDTAKRIGTFLYKAVIREGVAIKEAQASQQFIYDYAPNSNASKDYMSFVNEFIKRSRP